MSLNVSTLKDGRRAAIIRTSDRANFKQCRRKWGWSSHLKMNLGPIHLAGPLWFGSAVHYALEDFHGYNRFGSAERAFKAYCIATAKNYVRDLPSDYLELYALGKALMHYYENYWLKYKPMDQTYWEDGVPQVEVNFEIPIPIDCSDIVYNHAKNLDIDTILYRGTIDKVAIDENGELWCGEYKTAKVVAVQHYKTDPQISAYMWAMAQIYQRPVAGILYHQFIKRLPEPPRILSSGKVSTAKNLTTSYPLYRERLIDLYGSVETAPNANIEYLWTLASAENEDRDKYIQRDKIHRTTQQVASQRDLIILELEDMLNPDLPLYPNPTRDCSRMCSFESPCVSIDDGADWEFELETDYTERDLKVDRLWRSRLPDAQKLLADLDEQQERAFDPERDIDIGQIQILSREEAMRARIEAGDYPEDEYIQEQIKQDKEGVDSNPTIDFNNLP
jgi:hypothetical protein